jgi:O-antigen ligase
MSSSQQVILPQPATLQPRRGASSERAHEAARRYFDRAIFAFLCLFAILLPHSIKGSQHAWQIAFLLWMATLLVRRERPLPQRLTGPLLAFVVLSAISTALSPDPVLSWDRMKIVCLVLVGVVVAQNLHRLRQVRTVLYLLILSGVAAAGFTAWQYTYGLGVRVASIAPDAPLTGAHIGVDDIITKINGVNVHTAAQLEQAVRSAPANRFLRVDYVRGFPLHKRDTVLTREQMLASGLGTPALSLVRGKPQRAQGTLGHYVVFAEVLMQIACVVWGLLLASNPQKRGLQLLLGGAFIALATALFLTGTRAALAGLALGGFVAVMMLTGKRSRLWATAALALIVLAGLLWIRHTRGDHWLGTHDAGTSFRVMMWQESLPLIAHHPWFGVGMETIRNHWSEWNIRAYSSFHEQGHFHNDLIQIAVERGLLTLAAWLWFVVAYFGFLVRLIHRARKRSRFATGVATGVLASFTAYQVTALVHYDLGIETVAMMLFFFFGVAIAIDRMLQMPGAFDIP